VRPVPDGGLGGVAAEGRTEGIQGSIGVPVKRMIFIRLEDSLEDVGRVSL
jgi:hypothetical protein